MSFLKNWHLKHIFEKRTKVLASHIAELLPQNAHVLDLGCGDGTIDKLIMSQRPDIKIEGVDVFKRPKTHIPVTVYDGKTIPFEDNTFDVVMAIDVLHHTPTPQAILQEMTRVTKKHILLKDHNKNGFLAGQTLKIMDWVGNAAHGVSLPYNYLTMQEWQQAYHTIGLETVNNKPKMDMYPPLLAPLFERNLHFIALLKKQS